MICNLGWKSIRNNTLDPFNGFVQARTKLEKDLLS